MDGISWAVAITVGRDIAVWLHGLAATPHLIHVTTHGISTWVCSNNPNLHYDNIKGIVKGSKPVVCK